ncbi:ABC transporter ATP-binding protein [Paenibacillus sp. SI8]|uniref:ABC transporter ATP-binding protein n=1 Tax=unclassified Paenibacillus TaxID=185978 RepID=UPI003467B3BD
MNAVLHYVKQLSKFTGKRLYLNLLGMVFVSLLDGLGTLLLIPLLSISGIVSVSFGMNPVTELFSFLKGLSIPVGLLLVLGIFLFISISQNVLQRYLTLQNSDIHQNFTHYFRLRIHRNLLAANWDFYLNRRKSDIVNSLTTEMPRVNGGIYLFFQAVTTLIFTIIQIGLAFWLSPAITAFIVGCGVLLAIFSRKFSRNAAILGNHTVETSQKYMAGITDLFNGIKEVKSNQLEYSRLNWVRTLSERLKYEQESFNKLKTASQLLYRTASVVLMAGFLYMSVILFHARAEQLILIIVIFSRLWPRFINIQSNLEQVSSYIPSFKNLIELEQKTKEAAETDDVIQVQGNDTPLYMVQEIACKEVYFRYQFAEHDYALHDINLQIPANQMTAIVGRSGAGKSTLIDIIMGLIQPEKGQVLIDGKPLKGETLESLRRSISYVPQDPFLFHASIRENLLLVKPNATDEQIWEALESSSAAEFVRKLPQGLDALIGDRGIKLSGGERQRLVLGRALLRNPSILVLDEATSALDTENETKIQEVLDRLRGRTTLLVIAHRFSTIRNADQVIVLDQGRIVQNGEYKQLALEKKGMFRKLLGSHRELDLVQTYEDEAYDLKLKS